MVITSIAFLVTLISPIFNVFFASTKLQFKSSAMKCIISKEGSGITEIIMAKLAVIFPEEVPAEPTRKVQQQKTNDDIVVAIAAAARFKNLFQGGK